MNLYYKFLNFLAKGKVKAVLFWIVGAVLAETFIKNGFRKFDAEGFWSNSFLETWGFPLWFMYFIGVLEFVGGIALLIPKTRPFAGLTLAIIMIGALLTKTIFNFVDGLPSEYYYFFFKDVIFFLSNTAILLYFFSLAKPKKTVL